MRLAGRQRLSGRFGDKEGVIYVECVILVHVRYMQSKYYSANQSKKNRMDGA
jgi:hypothetical protein